MRKNKKGFTLMELLVVMAIILLLAGLLMGATQKAKEQAKRAAAKAMIAGLETAVAMFQADLGGYPSGTGVAGSTANLVSCLTTNAGSYFAGATTFNLPNASWSGPYMNFKQGDVVGGTIRDPWGREYLYAGPGYNHGGGINYSTYVSIWSTGPNGASDGIPPAGDDIGNWGR